MVVFEDRSTYRPGKDSVATVTLSVECSPGQVAELTGFLIGASSKAGVYSVAVDHVVTIPEIEGEAHGEQEVQRSDLEPEAAIDGQGSETELVGGPARLAQREHSVVAGTAGEGAEQGSGERDA